MTEGSNYRDDVFSREVRAGKRKYFFDVKTTRGNDLFMTITESKRSGFSDSGQASYEKHKIFLYKEDFEKFAEGLKEAIAEISELKEAFYKDVYVPGSAGELNPELEKALRVADFIDLGQLMAMDALQRKESCGGHFREEYQDAEGETLRDDVNFSFVGAWEYKGNDITKEDLHKEELKYENIKIAQRSYK